MANLMTFAMAFYKKLLSAPPHVRAAVEAAIKDGESSGLIPLGMRSANGGSVYAWFLYDRSKLSPEERERYLHERTPPGVPALIIDA
ncbi:MAG: hypothetical protein RL272_640 [Candidatus Parcubacteria bacterium]|jgi:hypothetical protein